MKKFIVVYYSPASAMKKMKDASPEDMKKGMEGWMAWAKKCGKGLSDVGAPLGNGHALTHSGSKASKKNVTGYSMSRCRNCRPTSRGT